MQHGKKILAFALAPILCLSLAGVSSLANGKALAASQYEELAVEDTIEFIYVDQAIVSLESEQNVAFGLKDEAPLEEATLVLHRTDNGAKFEFEATAIADGAALFTFSFANEADQAAYELDCVRYVSNGHAYEVAFSKDQVSAVAATGEGELIAAQAEEESEGRPYAFDVVRPELAEAIESAVVENGLVAYAVDGKGELTAHASVGEALENVDEGAQAANDYHEAIAEEAGQPEESAAEQTEDSSGASLLAQALEAIAPMKAFAAGGNTFVVGLDPGHGGSDPGASGYGLLEKDVNWKIAVACQTELNTYKNVKAVMSRSKDEKPGLAERVDRLVAAGAKVVVSIHNNASGTGKGTGSEVWVPNNSSYKNKETHVVGEQLGQKIVNKLAALGLANRGVKTRDAETAGYAFEDTHYPDGSLADYYTVIDTARRYGIPGIIVEHAFIDNKDDAAFLANDGNLVKLGKADAAGIAAQYGLVKKDGSSPEPEADKYLIMGHSKTTVAQMAAYYKSIGHAYPASTYKKYGAATIEDFCRILYEEAVDEGVRAEVVFAQAMHETGWLQFGGDVDPDQCNFCGLGATGGGNPGNSFNDYGADSVRMGLRAQIQHLKAYASTDDLNHDRIDPRFTYVTRGVAPSVNDLSGRWAANPAYGEKVCALMDDLLAYKVATSTKLTLSKSEMKNASSVYVDGVEYPVTWKNDSVTIQLPDTDRKVLQVYEFNTMSDDPYKVYPTHMYVWLLEYGATGYVATRASQFDDVMQYAGSSIRVVGKKGIRMITAVPTAKKKALAGAGLDGYTLEEYGTVVAWDDKLGGKALTLATSGAASNYAFKSGEADPIFKIDGTNTQYTNVLVGFSMEQCSKPMTMRSYMKLRDSTGQEVVLYGGPVHRSIGYIAYQNKNAFSKSTAAYAYVWEIIHAVYGADAK